MNGVAWILGVALAGVFGLAGVTKIIDLDRMREHFGYAKRQYQMIGLSEVVGAAAVIVGLIRTELEWIALAGAIGLGTLMIGALITHARVDDDTKQIIPALVMMALSIAFMIVISLR